MPSHSLIAWQVDRIPRLALVDGQYASVTVSVPPNPQLEDENLRGYVMLLSSHFQGFCRDLHSECVQALVKSMFPKMELIVQSLCTKDLELSRSNPKYSSIKADFERFGVGFDLTKNCGPIPRPRRLLTSTSFESII